MNNAYNLNLGIKMKVKQKTSGNSWIIVTVLKLILLCDLTMSKTQFTLAPISSTKKGNYQLTHRI